MKYDKTLTGKRLKALRKLLDLSQGQVAAVLNVDRSTYAYYELGWSHLSAEKLASWPAATGFLRFYSRPDRAGNRPRVGGAGRPACFLEFLSTSRAFSQTQNGRAEKARQSGQC